MDFLMDYLPAIQFAAALNIGYIIPDIMSKMNKVLNNINKGYVEILKDVRSQVVIKTNEVKQICVVETKDKRTTKGYIDKQIENLKSLKDSCDKKENDLEIRVDEFVNCSGYRSVFFYSALFSVLSLLIIPFCHQHNSTWDFRLFFYYLNVVSFIYLLVIFLIVVIKKRDLSCRIVFGFFILFVFISLVLAFLNDSFTPLFYVDSVDESILSFLSIVVAFLPGTICLLFLMGLLLYSTIVARIFAIQAWFRFRIIDKETKKLDELNKLFEMTVITEEQSDH